MLSLMPGACGRATAPVPAVHNVDIAQQIADSTAPFLLDVRSPEEYREGHIPGAVNIPYDELEQRLAEVSAGKEDEIVVYCRSGRRAGIAEAFLLAAGYKNVKDLDGHMLSWTAAGLVTEK